MENSDSSRVRNYRKSSVPRLRWTPALHDHFVQAVHKLGGKYKATPKKIMQMMAVRGLRISHIKSHLQMYRSTKDSMDPNGFIALKNYQERISDCITFLPLRQVSQGLREAPLLMTHRKHVKGQFSTFQGRRKITLNDEKLYLHEFEDKKESIAIAKKDGEIPRTNIIESPNTNTMKTCDHQPGKNHGHINLDLTLHHIH